MTVEQKLAELRGTLEQRKAALHDVFVEAGPDMDMEKVKSLSGDTVAKVAELQVRNKEISDLGEQIDAQLTILSAAKNATPAAQEGEPAEKARKADAPAKSFGELFMESQAYKGRARSADGPSVELDIELKTLMETGAGWAPETMRTGLIVLDAQRPVQVTDLIPQIPTSQSAYVYMEETTFTNNAAEVTEANTYGEAALAFTERTSTVRKIGVWLPITDEQLEDVPGIRAYLDQRLPFMIRQRLDSQILVGDGNAPNLRGINNVVNVQTQAKGADPTPDAIYKAATKVRVTGRAFPDAVVMHPNDWQDIRLLRTADGIYIWGNPTEAGPERVWGLRVVQSDAQTENTGLLGDFRGFSLMANKRGIDVQVSNSHSDYFVKGKQAIRADMRVALVVTRPEAFCMVTGI